ncbi:MAG: hypothetical protein EGP68_08355 [Lachnospiraceae bacterium]|nr:hypothetical protein [Lachnospiraceae bacterium]
MAARKKVGQHFKLQTVEAFDGRILSPAGCFFLFTKSTPASIVIDTGRKTARKSAWECRFCG